MSLKYSCTQVDCTVTEYKHIALGGYREMQPRMLTGTLRPDRPAWPDGPRWQLRKLWSYLLILEWTCPCWQHTRPGADSPGPSRSPAVLRRGWPPECNNMQHSVRTTSDILLYSDLRFMIKQEFYFLGFLRFSKISSPLWALIDW